MTGVASWSPLRFEVWGGEGKDVLVLIQISFNPSSSTLCPSITPPILLPLPPAPPLHPFPPSTHHLPPQGWNTGKLTGEERVKEKGWAAFCLPVSRVCVCRGVGVCACVGVKYSLCGVYEAVCQEGRGGKRGSRWTASLLSAVLCPHLLFPSFSLYLLSVSLSPFFPLSLFFPSCLPLFTRPFSLLLSFYFFLFHSLLSCGRWQRGAAAAVPEQKPECEQEMGRGEGGCGKRRRRKEVGVRHMESLVKGPPQRECACGSVMNREGGRGTGYNGCPLRQRFDSNRQRRGETDRQTSRQICRMVQRKAWKWCFFGSFFLL